MTFLIAETFTSAFNRLAGPDQKAVKASVFDLQMGPAGNGLQLHRIDKSKDPNFWSVRVNRDIRLVVHKTGDSLLLAYVDHHDAAYAWAERRRIEAHPRTGAIQIVEVRERVEDGAAPATPRPAPAPLPSLFAGLDDDTLLSLGVPADWLADVRAVNEDGFFALAAHLPAEAAEALLQYATTGRLAPAPVPAADPFAHPDAQRRIRLIANQEELEQALAFPWEKWGVFLHPSQRALVERSFNGPARVAGQLEHGVRPRIASDVVLRARLNAAAAETGLKGFSERFLLSEWTHVVDAWGLSSLDAYTSVPRMGRKSRLGPNQRARLWPVFAAVRTALAAERYTTWAQVFSSLADALAARAARPFDHVVIDEAQDLAPAELRFFAALAPAGADGLFLAGDVGQRIFQHPFSWAGLGVEVRGRSHTLKVCYRTSQQIRRAADRLLPTVLRDADGLEDERRGIVSVFDGPAPEVARLSSTEAEAERVQGAVSSWLAEGIAPQEIGVFVRTEELVPRARAALASLAGAERITTAPMSLAKGLEFRAVVVMACDEGTLPLDERIADAADEAELDDIYETERRLLYVAATRAREHLLLSGVAPTSEYLVDFAGGENA
ncbi:3'-5' exonuclease [Xanthobacter sp. 126]|uniref:3'-5' exonuclease n=1 Tax=Xanthobacter sp. 126 TaxID=1131814 RepID=UPI00045E87B8|nr:3'-5' exonuclease [Xanthobacter sp. 126]